MFSVERAVVDVCRRLQRAGHSAYVVGGAVRDLLLGRAVGDWDVATAARPEQVQRLFARAIPTGIAHGTVTVLVGEQHVEVTTFRGEGDYTDSRRPDSVEFIDDLDRDLARRDFTINAIALDPLRDALVDPLGGERDLQRRLVRAVGDAAERFREDGLRPLRGVRIATVLGFELESATRAAIPGALGSFRKVSCERVRDEVLKLLAAPSPSTGIELLRQTGLLAEILPELLPMVGLAQNRHHRQDVYRHTLSVVDACSDDPVLRFAALLHDVGKPPTARPRDDDPSQNTFYRHEEVGAAQAGEIAARLRLSNRQRDRICRLVRHHLFGIDPRINDAAIRRLIRRVGADLIDDLFALRRADLADRPDAEQRLAQLDELRRRVDAQLQQAVALSVADLAVSGRDVIARAGRPPGPYVGRVLRALLERVTESPQLNDREQLLPLIDEALRDEP